MDVGTISGYGGLLVSAFLAATVLPFSSEVVLATMALSESYSNLLLWIFATAGNLGGAIVNWWLGQYCLHFRDRRWFPFNRETLDKTRQYFLRYGMWSLLFTWLPVVGDPLAFMGGVFRVHLLLFTVLVFIGKGARYAIILWTVTS